MRGDLVLEAMVGGFAGLVVRVSVVFQTVGLTYLKSLLLALGFVDGCG